MTPFKILFTNGTIPAEATSRSRTKMLAHVNTMGPSPLKSRSARTEKYPVLPDFSFGYTLCGAAPSLCSYFLVERVVMSVYISIGAWLATTSEPDQGAAVHL